MKDYNYALSVYGREDEINSLLSYNNLKEAKVSKEIAYKYLETLLDHIEYVCEAGLAIGLDRDQCIQHDSSKFNNMEFYSYAKQFQGDGDEEFFPYAWLDHIHRNEHHWEYWIFPDGYNYTRKGETVPSPSIEEGVVIMPEKYVKEMVADWLGASMAYTGSWDMTDWLEKNLPKIRLHSISVGYLKEILDILGYRIEYNKTRDGKFIFLI